MRHRYLIVPAFLATALPCHRATAQAEVVTDLRPGIHGSAGDALVSFKGNVYFQAGLPATGSELYIATGPKTAKLFKDLHPGKSGSFVNSSQPTNFCEFGGKLYFTATFPSVGRELGVSDGTVAGTKLFADVWSGGSSTPSNLTVSGKHMFFFARTSSRTLGIFVTDGSAKGTKLLRNFGGQGVTSMGRMGASGSVFFGADGVGGVELWTSDGTAGGTKLFKDLRAGSARSWPGTFAQLGTTTVFTASITSGKRHLLVSDGSVKGTVLVGHTVNVRGPLVPFKGSVYFEGENGDADWEIWKSDGTKAGTKRVVDVRRGVNSSDPDWLTNVQDKWLYFSAQVFDGRGRELWRTDGSEPGTLQVAEIYPGSNNSSPSGAKSRRHYVVNGDYVYFVAISFKLGRELFAIKTSRATSYQEGIGCGAKPTLAATFPKLGSTVTASGTRGPAAGTTAILAVGLPALAPFNMGGGCLLRVDFAGPVTLRSFKTTSANWTLPVKVPATKALQGLVLEGQAALATTSPRGFDLTNGVRLLIGD